MDIAVVGTGYVGLVTGVCLAEIGNNVTCIDIDEAKIALLKKRISPIYEEGLTELLKKNVEKDNLSFTTDYEKGFVDKSIIYIAVGTPQSDDGSADLRYIDMACKDIANHLTTDAIIVTKSTVPVGTNRYIKETIEAHLKEGLVIRIASIPEFLRQGSAVHDTFHGDRIVIGSEDEETRKTLEKLHTPFDIPIVKTDLNSAEMIKYASNAFLATKISFINEMANLCEKLGANIDDVSKGMGMDKRIGSAFLNAGVGYGGSCFPKDTNAMLAIGEKAGYSMQIIKNVIRVNKEQRELIVEKILNKYKSIKGKTVALLGLAFKPGTDDMREAPAIQVAKRLVEEEVTIQAYDPVAMENAQKVLPAEVAYHSTIEAAISNADFAIILTDWPEIKEYPLENYNKHMSKPVLFDGRNCFSLEDVKKSGIEYNSIGRPTVTRESDGHLHTD